MSNANGILPVPASLLRKNNKRLSMASATRLLLLHALGPSLLNSRPTHESAPSSVRRKSVLSTPLSRARSGRLSGRLSGNRLPRPDTTNGAANGVTPTGSNPTSGASRIPNATSTNYGNNPGITNSSIPAASSSLPLRDKQYLTLIQNEVYEFLRLNKFEVEMNHPLTSKTLKQPTQKDFVLIFQFLYAKIDPYYRFSRSIETEVFTILKLLEYPYLDGINRSQISAVGGNYWPSFLAMLYWLVKLNLQLGEIDTLQASNKSLDDKLDDIYDQYISQTFIRFSRHGDTDYSDLYRQFQASFEAFHHQLDEEKINHHQQHQQLTVRLEELSAQVSVYEDAEKKSRALENDLIKFKAYIETVEARRYDWDRILLEIDKEIERYRQTSGDMARDITSYEANLRQKGLDVEKINKLTGERSDLSKTIDVQTEKINDTTEQLDTKQLELRNLYDSLDGFIKHYNNLIYKIQYKNLTSHQFELKMNEVVWDLSKEIKPSEVLNKNLKDEKVELLRFKNEINTRIHSIEDQKIKIQEQIDLLTERIFEQKEELESLASKLTIDKLNYDQFYGTISDKATTYSTKIEKLTREINYMKVDANSEHVAVLHQYNDVVIEAETLKGQLYRQKNSLHNQIQKIIENTINFKLNIQLSLQEVEELVIRELETDLE